MMTDLENYNFADFGELIKLCQRDPGTAGRLRQQLIDRQQSEANRMALLQYQFVTEERMKLLTTAEAKQVFIQQQLAQNIERLKECIMELEQRCHNVSKLIQKSK